MRAAAKLVWLVVGFVVPCVGVYLLLRHAWPEQHDLSDIATGLMRIGLALLAGLAGAAVTLGLLRMRRRR